jgi:hypothetical protein
MIAVNVMTYQIHRYPAELVDVVHLSDGARVVIRPVLPQDRELISTFFDDLTADARCNRFMHPVREPSYEFVAAVYTGGTTPTTLRSLPKYLRMVARQ